jgi:hypothetical protein
MRLTIMESVPQIGRRRRGTDPLRKPGWQVRTSVADAVRQAVEAGMAESQNALVERAVLRFLAEKRREKLYASYAEAAQDPAFMADMRAVADAFETAVGDGLQE